jgi:hypothetical protein
VLLEPGNDGVDGLGVLSALHARELAGLHEVALGCHGLVPVDVGHAQLALVLELVVEGIFLLADDGRDGQAVLTREVEVALVAAGDAHDGTGAVVEKDVVGNPQRGGLAGHGVDHVAAGEDAVLLARGALAVDGGDLLGGLLEAQVVGLVLGALDELGGKVALGREHHERDAKDGVGARGEDGDRAVGGRHAVLGGQLEVDLGALGAANPVALLGL